MRHRLDGHGGVVTFQSLGRGVVKWKGVLYGAATFLATHAVIVAKWERWFGGTHQPWFLNDGGAVAFTVTCVFVASASASAMRADPDDARVDGVNIAVGASVAMTVVVVVIGPGPLLPMVIALGGFVIGASCLAGSLITRAFH
jgi:hypothetical protein